VTISKKKCGWNIPTKFSPLARADWNIWGFQISGS
jgi:hypothetical protein